MTRRNPVNRPFRNRTTGTPPAPPSASAEPVPGSITQYIEAGRKGQEVAAALFVRLLPIALQTARGCHLQPHDQDDVAAEAVGDLLLNLREYLEDYPDIRRRDDLHRFLRTMVRRQAGNCWRFKERGGRRGLVGAGGSGEDELSPLQQAASNQPPPEEPVAARDEADAFAAFMDAVIGQLDEESRTVLRAGLEGVKTADIAALIGKSERTVQRLKVEIIDTCREAAKQFGIGPDSGTPEAR